MQGIGSHNFGRPFDFGLTTMVYLFSTDSKISALERKLAQLQGQIRIGGENIVKMGGGGSRVDGSGSNGSTNTSVASPRFKPYSK